jgi:hypothetical protein
MGPQIPAASQKTEQEGESQKQLDELERFRRTGENGLAGERRPLVR